MRARRITIYATTLITVLMANPAPAQQPDLEQIVGFNEPAVVTITGKRGTRRVQGSGVVVDTRGYVLATAHQVEGVSALEAQFVDGTRVKLTAVEVLPDLEYALLKSARPLPHAARIGSALGLRSGAPLVAIAAPDNLAFTTIRGIVANPERRWRGIHVVQTDLRVKEGASGGPVFDRNGLLVGLIILNLEDASWISAFNPIDNVADLLRRYGIAAEANSENVNLLVPAAGINERELRAVEAYNRGVSEADPQSKAQAYDIATRLLPAFYEAWFNLGAAQLRLGALREAQAAYARASELRPRAVEVQRNLGRLYLREPDLLAARRAFERAAELAPDDAQSYNDLGEALRRLEEFDEALAAFERALELAPEYAAARYNLGLTAAAAGQVTRAAEAFETYLKQNPNARDAGQVRAWISRLRGAN